MKEYKVLGLMSGTSLDGLDIAFCRFWKEENWGFEIVAAKTYSYDQTWLEILTNILGTKKSYLDTLDKELAIFYADRVKEFILKHQVVPDFISSHGHTVFHNPDKGITLQIGDGQTLANLTNLSVVNDFRSNDVKLGGQGAPLVPIGDHYLFSEYEYCLNIGGFCNISFLQNDQRVAFDICPSNLVLNHLANRLDMEFDENGNLAKEGEVNHKILRKLNGLNYYHDLGPKSLGKEWVVSEIFPVLDKGDIAVADLLATYVEHISDQIVRVLGDHAMGKLFITGGGSFNQYLISRIEAKTACTIVIPDALVIEYKEALIFGFLGVLRMRNEHNVLSSVTGASKDHCSGIIHNP